MLERGLHENPHAAANAGSFAGEAWAAIAKNLGVSPRQLDVARSVVAGQGDKEIATGLGLSWGAVQTHLKRLYKRLNIRGRVALATRVCAAYRAWRAESPPPTGCPENTGLESHGTSDRLSVVSQAAAEKVEP